MNQTGLRNLAVTRRNPSFVIDPQKIKNLLIS